MRVYNLTSDPLAFRSKVIPANGGSVEVLELDLFIPAREKALSQAGVISFGSLPSTWRPKVVPPPKMTKAAPKPAAKPVEEKVFAEPAVAAVTEEEKKPEPQYQSTAEKFKRRG